MKLGEQIKSKRKKEKLSAKDLAELLNVPMDRVYKWEKGARPSDPEDYIKLKDWLNSELESKLNKKITVDAGMEATVKDVIQLKAIVKMLRGQVAKLVAKDSGRDLEEVLDEQDRDTIVNVKDLINSK